MFFNIHSFINILFNFCVANSVLDAECKKMSDTFLLQGALSNGEAGHVQRAVEGKGPEIQGQGDVTQWRCYCNQVSKGEWQSHRRIQWEGTS